MAEQNGVEKQTPSSLLEESLEAGMYYERVFSPEKVRVQFKDDGSIAAIVLEDKNGETLNVTGKRLISRLLMYHGPYTEFKKVSELRALEQNLLQKALNGAVQKRNKDLKAMYDRSGKLCGVTSTLHKQISWAEIRSIVENAIKEITGTVEIPKGWEHNFKWSYRVPSKNKNVSSWVGVHAGNNIIKGRSGIRVFTRFRTERERDEGGVKAPACLNWCGMWQFPRQFFNIPTKRLNSIVKMVGAEQVKDIQMFQFHIKPNMEQFGEDLKAGLEGMIKAMNKITPVINKSIKSPLSKEEMKNILLAYQSKAKSYLPDYIVEQILDHVLDETVWGFSQAVSWVRTHGDFKFTESTHPMFKPVEDRDLTWRLEQIAGEVLSLTPMIVDFHSKHGQFTLESLAGAEKAAEIYQQQKEREERAMVKAIVSK